MTDHESIIGYIIESRELSCGWKATRHVPNSFRDACDLAMTCFIANNDRVNYRVIEITDEGS